MDPIPAAITSLLNALQSVGQELPAAAPTPAALLALVGKDVGMIYLGQIAGGKVSLALPSGQVVTAQGQLPYPDGSQLLVRILAGSSADAPVRLQTLQATPPAAPAILAPLYQGEAATLLASLGQADPPPGTADLTALLQLLGQNPPDAGQIQAALGTLPPAAQEALRSVLGLPPGASQADLASALETWLSGAPPHAQATASASVPAADLVQRFQSALDRNPEVPPAQGDVLVTWLRQLLGAADPRSQETAPGGPPATPAQLLQQQLSGHTGAPAEVPATWEAWLRAGIKALNDPGTAGEGAAFHAAQAKEGTAFYELPLPWSPQHPLQMWVESDRDPKGQGQAPEETKRVLLGLSFSRLGETRLGIAKGPAGLQVRVWAEHPEPLEASRGAVEGELQDLGSSVDLKIMRLTPGPGGVSPSLRSQVTGATLEALG
jgi:hypothetical protein